MRLLNHFSVISRSIERCWQNSFTTSDCTINPKNSIILSTYISYFPSSVHSVLLNLCLNRLIL